tara:strand:+ start:107 stop:760 length:654 start_codon:yes stop_codon:yes gene_type:complete
MKRFIFIFLIFLLTSCKINFFADLYTSDLIELANSNNQKILSLPMEVEFQVASCEDLDTEKRIMSTFFSDFEFLGCDLSSEDFMSYAKAKVSTPVTNSNKIPDDLIGFHAYYSEDKTFIYLDAIINSDYLKKLKDYFYEQTFQELTLSDSKLRINLNNDKEFIKVIIMPSFVDGKAIALETEYELQKREKLTIETSNVSNSHLESSFWTPILSIIIE